MKRVQEIIYIVPEEREEFLEKCLNPTESIRKFYWDHGVRYQYFFALNDLILMTFEYVGNDFYKDMDALVENPEMHKYIVRQRRRDVDPEKLTTTNWWAPVKKLGCILTTSPTDDEEEEVSQGEMLSGCMSAEEARYDVTFDDDDWSESIHI